MTLYRIDVGWFNSGYYTRSTTFNKESSCRRFYEALSKAGDNATQLFCDEAGYSDGYLVELIGMYKVTEEQL